MFTSLYEKFRQPLLRYVRYKVGDMHVAEDIVQEVFIKAFRSIDTLKETQKFQSWLYTIATNTIYDHYRKHNMSLTDALDRADEEEMDESVMQELDCCLFSFLETLSPAHHDVLQALYFKELTLSEYAQKNDLNLSTVKSHAKRAKIALRDVLQECCSFENNSRGEMVHFYQKESKCKLASHKIEPVCERIESAKE